MKRRSLKYKYGQRSFSGRRRPQTGKRLLSTLLIVGFLIYALLAWILPFFIGGLSFLNNFKSQPKSTTPVSENTTLAPPVLNIPFEATNTATIKIKGYSTPNSSVEIYLDDNLSTTVKVKDDGSFLSDNISLSLGTNNIYGKTVDDKGQKSLPSKPIQVDYSNEKPKLDLNSPSDNQVIQGDKKVTVSGSTNAGKNISLTVNGIVVIVDGNGNFSKTIEINDGDNNITVTATDRSGNTTQLSRKVTYQAG